MRERPDPREYFGPDPGSIPLGERIAGAEAHLRKVLASRAPEVPWNRRDGSALIKAARDLRLELLLCARLELMYQRRRLRDAVTLDSSCTPQRIC